MFLQLIPVLKGNEMLALQKTKHSSFCNDLFATSKGLNLSHNHDYLFHQMTEQCHSKGDAEKAKRLYADFKNCLRTQKLKLNYFAVGHESATNKYLLAYEVESTVHRNDPARVDQWFDVSIPFSFAPQLIACWVANVLQNIPYELLAEVANGN